MPAKPSQPHPPRALVVMDPIDEIKPAKDTTLAMLLAAQERGWELWYAEQRDLWLRDGVASAGCARSAYVTTCTTGSRSIRRIRRPLADFEVILMRKDPPFDMEYIYTTYILERAEEQGVLVANRPQGLRDMNEKVFTAWFPQCCAPTLITRDMADMHAFLREHQRIVCKPLYGMGGRSIFVIDRGDKNANVIFETMTEYGTRFAIVQRYIPDIVTTGDSRMLVIDGEPAPYALARIPLRIRQPRQPGCRRARRRPRAERARPLARRPDRPDVAATRDDVRRPRRDRRLRHRDQRHESDRHA